MSVGSKYSNIQIFRLMLYRRALHPELFQLHGRQLLRHGDYEVETWLLEAGHVVRFNTGGEALTETVLENADHLPEVGLVHAIPCLGEKDYEMKREDGDPFHYVTAIQTETLAENIYASTMRDLRESAHDPAALSVQWTDEDGAQCMSLLEVQKYRKEFHVQSFHLLGASGTVLRTQSMFEVC